MLSDKYYYILYPLFFICSVFFSFLINTLFLKFSKTLGIRNNTEPLIIRWGSQSKPAVGGISFYILLLLSLAVYSIFFHPKQVFPNKEFIGFLLALNFGFLMGLADDAFNTRPFLKLFIQILCGITLIASGIYIKVFSQDYMNYGLTIFWVVGIMNSINMIDNMDAISAIISVMVILSALLIIFYLQDFSNIYFIALTGVLASLIGFLILNWHPSKIYMGDTGSQFLGVFLASIGIIYFWDFAPAERTIPISESFILPVLVFMLPIVDTTIVVINRLSKGTSPFVGGKDHTTHSLALLGMTDTWVAIIFACISVVNLFLVVLIIKYIPEFTTVHACLFFGYVLVFLGVMFYISRRKRGALK
ncbi:MAG: MraY family glycosyltransferase [Bacteroidota bacterium]